MPRVYIRAFNKEGYHKDIAILSEQQIHLIENRVKDGAMDSAMSGIVGVGVSISPADFPEVVKFEVVIKG